MNGIVTDVKVELDKVYFNYTSNSESSDILTFTVIIADTYILTDYILTLTLL
jgi:hypothetical protein